MSKAFFNVRMHASRVMKSIRAKVRKLRGKTNTYKFMRRDTPAEGTSVEVMQICNLLDYTKTSHSSYNGQDFPAGYHTFDLNGFHLRGQRQPQERLHQVPFDFTGKTVLDIGCNQGGMLFALADKIAQGIGIDFDYRVVNAANRIRLHTGANQVSFYVFNVEKEPLDLVRDFIPGGKVDIVFLLAVCMWIGNWKEVIDFSTELSSRMLFESNGTQEQQEQQVDYLRTKYQDIQQISDKSIDDSSQQSRSLYFCQ